MTVPPPFYRELLDSIQDGVYFVDRERRITFWNRGAEEITGYRALDVVGGRCWDRRLNHVDASGRELCQDGCPLTATLADGVVRVVDAALLHHAGHRVAVRIRVAPILDEAGSIIGAAETFRDLTSEVQALRREEELKRLAYLDPLTGVGNRRYAEVEMANRLDEFNRHGIPFGVLFVDIDRFKSVNDHYGHEVGDEVLKLVASTLRHALRAHDFVGRWGGEEFVVVAAHAPGATLPAIGDRIRALVEQSVAYTSVGPISVTVSVGAVIARSQDTVPTLVSRSDGLMYRAKARGRNRVAAEEGVVGEVFGPAG